MSDDLTYEAVLVSAQPTDPPPALRSVQVEEPDRAAWATSAAEQLVGAAHVIASGADAPGALTLAADHPERVVSLVLVDPQVDLDDPEHGTTMGRVEVPTLVIAAAPDADSPIDQGQSVAGGVDNGVFVIIDGTEAPSLSTRPSSVLEWAGAFMSIAEGLSETRNDLIRTSDQS